VNKYLTIGAFALFIGVVVLGFAHSSSDYVASPLSGSISVSAPRPVHSSISLAPPPALNPAVSAAQTSIVVAPTPSSITAEEYLVGNAETGQVYLSKNVTTGNPIASISKLFTALVADENMDPNQIIQITQAMLDVYPDSYGFYLGEKFTLNELMYPLLIESNNNIAEGIAQTYGYSIFIQKMNALAASIGLARTHFQDASGLSDGNISDAQDLFTFARYLYASQRSLLTLTTTPSWSFATTSDHGAHIILSTDPFIGDPHLVGGKTGRTNEAGETMMTIFNYESAGKNYPIAIIVLHSAPGERQIDSERLLFEAMAVIDAQK
jgi:D-alanyl-D-alanine carboxypeptidase